MLDDAFAGGLEAGDVLAKLLRAAEQRGEARGLIRGQAITLARVRAAFGDALDALKPQISDAPPAALLSASVAKLNLAPIFYEAFKALGAKTIGDVLELTNQQLKGATESRSIGNTRIRHLDEALEELGLARTNP